MLSKNSLQSILEHLHYHGVCLVPEPNRGVRHRKSYSMGYSIRIHFHHWQ